MRHGTETHLLYLVFPSYVLPAVIFGCGFETCVAPLPVGQEVNDVLFTGVILVLNAHIGFTGERHAGYTGR